VLFRLIEKVNASVNMQLRLLLLSFQAELYRVRKEFDKAEPLYLEAINILEESFGPDDIR
jgi:hypothetical protein